MYLPPQFAAADPAHARDLIRGYPFASLISVDDDGLTFVTLVAGMVAFELEVTDMQCKLKVNQHRPESHQAMHAAYATGNDDQRVQADWMQRLGLVKPLSGGV